MIETALTLPLLLLLSVSVYEFGRAFQHWQVLTNAAREGARIAVLPGTTDEAIEARVENYLEAGQLTVPEQMAVDIVRNALISIGPDADDTASASTVSVNYPFEFMVLQPVMRLVAGESEVGAPITMNATATMRNE
jgi:Flp pilus assembly protein TadG